MRIRKGDNVAVIAGNESGSRGTVLAVDRKNGKIVVEGVNKKYRHVKRGHPKSPQGGRLHTESAIDASNCQLICPETNEPTRVGVRMADDGSKELYAKRSGAFVRTLAAARKS